MANIYLDNAATTRPLPEVVEAMGRIQLEHFGNPSSTHLFGDGPRKALLDAREFLRGSVGASRLVFTSGGTEADVLGVTGAARLKSPGRVLVGAADHPAILAQKEALAQTSHRMVEIGVDAGGTIHPEALSEAMGPDVRVVSILHGHNELGGLADLGELAEIVRSASPQAHIHVDLVQTFGKVAFDFDDAPVDSIAVSGHKFHGPRGAGFLACISEAEFAPLQAGGGQEDGVRGGTENVAGAVGLAVAAERALTHLSDSGERMEDAVDLLFERIRGRHADAKRLGGAGSRLPHVLSMRIPKVVATSLQERASEGGVAFSVGAACHAGKTGDNHVLRAVGMGRRVAREVFRLSVCPHSTEQEIEAAAEILSDEADELLRIAAGL